MEWNKLKKVTALGLAGAMLAGTLMTASAAPEDTPARSDVDVNFISGTIDKEEPPNPDPDPDPDAKPKPPLVGGGDDDLAVFAPAFDFGTVEIVDEDRDHPVKAQTYVNDTDKTVKYQRNYVAVTDIRGANTGWNVTLQIPAAFTAADQTVTNKTLTGVSVVLSNGDVVSQTDGINEDGIIGIEKGVDGEGKKKETEIVPGGSAIKIFSAEAPKGQGTYVQKFGLDDDDLVTKVNPASTADPKENYKGDYDTDQLFNEDVVLRIPRGTKIDKTSYSTKLVWTIADTPTAP